MFAWFFKSAFVSRMHSPKGADCRQPGTLRATVNPLQDYWPGIDGTNTVFIRCINDACIGTISCQILMSDLIVSFSFIGETSAFLSFYCCFAICVWGGGGYVCVSLCVYVSVSVSVRVWVCSQAALKYVGTIMAAIYAPNAISAFHETIPIFSATCAPIPPSMCVS